MKKLETLGKVLSKNQQRLVFGGNQELGTCSAKPDACDKTCSCNTPGTNICSSTANTATCNCDGTIVEITC